MGKYCFMNTTLLPKIIAISALMTCKSVAGDMIQTTDGTYAGNLNGKMLTTASNLYGGVILGGGMIVKPDCSYGGYVTSTGVIIDAAGNTAGFISNWRKSDDE